MSESSVPIPTFGPNGFVAPEEQDVLNGVLADMNAAFGGGLNLSLATPQGQLATTESAAIMAALEIVLSVMNGVDPAFAAGRMQDAIARIYFLTRLPATPTIVVGTCTGANGTVIPTGTLVQDVQGNIYAAVGAGVIPVGGSIDLQFAAQNLGPNPCPAGTLTVIYQAISGWDSITNAADGVPGQAVESRAAFEERREQSVQANARGPIAAIQGAVLNVSGVTDAYSYENDTAAPVTINGVTIAAHAIYVCVNGGTDQAVAEAILSKKAPGAAYTGATTVAVKDTSPGFTPPYPSYNVNFQRPTALRLYMAVTMVNGPNVPSDANAQVKAAIQGAFAGQDGGLRPTIGSTIWALRFATAIASLGPWAQLESLLIDTAATPVTSSVNVPINKIPSLAASDIAVTFS